jgi:hypothetical protein
VLFQRCIGVDYSGADTPTASLKGLRIYMAEGDASPDEVQPPPSPRKYWTREDRRVLAKKPGANRAFLSIADEADMN